MLPSVLRPALVVIACLSSLPREKRPIAFDPSALPGRRRSLPAIFARILFRRIFTMPRIELPDPQRKDAIASLKRYFEENFEPVGELPAGLLLDFFLEEVGPAVYNKALSDAQIRLQQRVADLEGELYEEPFQYWTRLATKRKGRR